VMNGKKLDVPDWFICFLKGVACCILLRVLFCLYRIENNKLESSHNLFSCTE
jgi:hypothetical protein